MSHDAIINSFSDAGTKSLVAHTAGIPDTFTGQPNFDVAKPADNCWVMAQHQWANEGCTAVHERNDTIGGPVNEARGGGEILCST